MGILFGFQAKDITTKVTSNLFDGNSTTLFTTPLTIDPVTDAVNNVRFACNGFSAPYNSCEIRFRTRSFFTFRIPQQGRITVFGHLTHFGVSSASARAPAVFWDFPSVSVVLLTAQMRVRVRGANGNIVFTRTSEERRLFHSAPVSEYFVSPSETHIVSARIMEQFLTVAPPDIVLPEDKIFVRVQYNMVAGIINSGAFALDFDAAGAGLNVPMVVVNH